MKLLKDVIWVVNYEKPGEQKRASKERNIVMNA